MQTFTNIQIPESFIIDSNFYSKNKVLEYNLA